MNETPILDAVRRADGMGLKVWCIHCNRWHIHGLGDGRRVAHCSNPDSPYHSTGYVLRIGGASPTRIRSRTRVIESH